MDRRELLYALGVGALGLLSGCSADPADTEQTVTVNLTTTVSKVPQRPPTSTVPSTGTNPNPGAGTKPSAGSSTEMSAAGSAPVSAGSGPSNLPPSQFTKVKPWKTIIAEVPDNAPTVALTIDDGISSEVVGAYVELAKATGLRLTFFVNGVNQSWTDHKDALQPMVDSGQIQLANHTWNHPDITKLSDAQIVNQLSNNNKFLKDTFGVDSRPYFRPPFFARNARTDNVATGEGYSVITWWTGSFGDAAVLTPAQILANAQTYLSKGRIVIGHANHPPILQVMDKIGSILQERGLQSVTLQDVFLTS